MKNVLISIALLSISMLSNAEGNDEKNVVMQTLSFKVVDASNESIAGAEIEIEKLGLISYTDMEGNLVLDIPANMEENVKISFISYKDKVLNIKDIKEGVIILIEE